MEICPRKLSGQDWTAEAKVKILWLIFLLIVWDTYFESSTASTMKQSLHGLSYNQKVEFFMFYDLTCWQTHLELLDCLPQLLRRLVCEVSLQIVFLGLVYPFLHFLHLLPQRHGLVKAPFQGRLLCIGLHRARNVNANRTAEIWRQPCVWWWLLRTCLHTFSHCMFSSSSSFWMWMAKGGSASFLRYRPTSLIPFTLGWMVWMSFTRA